MDMPKIGDMRAMSLYESKPVNKDSLKSKLLRYKYRYLYEKDNDKITKVDGNIGERASDLMASFLGLPSIVLILIELDSVLTLDDYMLLIRYGPIGASELIYLLRSCSRSISLFMHRNDNLVYEGLSYSDLDNTVEVHGITMIECIHINIFQNNSNDTEIQLSKKMWSVNHGDKLKNTRFWYGLAPIWKKVHPDSYSAEIMDVSEPDEGYSFITHLMRG